MAVPPVWLRLYAMTLFGSYEIDHASEFPQPFPSQRFEVYQNYAGYTFLLNETIV